MRISPLVAWGTSLIATLSCASPGAAPPDPNLALVPIDGVDSNPGGGTGANRIGGPASPETDSSPAPSPSGPAPNESAGNPAAREDQAPTDLARSEPEDSSAAATPNPEPGSPTATTPRPAPLASGEGLSPACLELVTDATVNWRAGALQTDQEIVQCLAQSLGTAVGFGQNARGGFDPNGGSQLVVIARNSALTVEQQLVDALAGDEPAWIVFDKLDFADPFEIGLYRRFCDDPQVLAQLDSSEAECLDHRAWCDARNLSDDSECLEEFFNEALNEGDLPIRNPVIGSNKTLDGRLSEAFFRFSGFAIGSDSGGEPVQTSENVIVTHLRFAGAGHTEDHELDPDMLRSTGASRDVWIHKNEFDLTGDSAFDVKVGARDITISFNRVVDVKRSSLHGSSDSREINAQITTTLHHNAFVTRDENYLEFGNTARRVPLIRRGTAHLWNNLLMNYRKDILSVRVGASVLMENNLFLVNAIHQEKDSLEDSLAELAGNLIRDVDRGNFRQSGSLLWFSDETCLLDPSTQTSVDATSGQVADADIFGQYSAASQAILQEQLAVTGQELIDYIGATAGPQGAAPFNSPLAPSRQQLLQAPRVSCQ